MKEQELSDYFKMISLSDATLDRSADRIAFTSSRTYKEYKKAQQSEIKVVTVNDPAATLTFADSDSRNHSPKFSEDGSKMAYISKTAEENFIVIVDLMNDRREKVLIEGSLEDFDWDDGNSLILLIKDKETDEEKKEEEEGNDGYFFEERHKFSSLWLYVPGSGLSRITNGIQIWDFSVNNDKIAAVTSELPYNWSWYESQISLIDKNTGRAKTVYTPTKRQIAHPRLSPGNSKIAFVESLWSDRGVCAGDLIILDLKTGKSTNITENHERSYSWLIWKDDNSLYALSNKSGEYELSYSDLKNFSEVWKKSGSVHPVFYSEFSYANGKFALCFSDSSNPEEVMIIDEKSGKEMRVTKINDELKGLTVHPAKKISWKSKDGLEIFGLFRSAGKDRPVVVLVHGGPTSSSTDAFLDHSSMLAGEGFSVFMPNYRGSIGRGRKYAEMNRGDMGGMDLVDILSGVEYLISEGLAQKGKIHITGGSYGGFMTAWAVSQTDIFTSGVALFGITDWLSFHGVTSLATWDSIHYDEDPYKFEKFVKFSPIRFIDNIKTPLLLMHGEEDPYVPIGQFYQFYRALKEKGKDARFLIFPREGHGFREKKHIEMYTRETDEWLKSHS